MPVQYKKLPAAVGQPFASVGFESLCMELGRGGQRHLERIRSLIEQIAPAPGRIVYFHTTKLPMQLSGLRPVIFSARDATTHVQVAEVNFAMTSAAALSFVGFVAQRVPFLISEIRTRREMPFHNPDDHRPHRDFATLVGQQGYIHSFVESHSSDALFSITSKLLFSGLSAGLVFPASAYELQKDLARFLFFHNNFRFVPWLEGRTPIQRLRTFKRFQGIHSFNPLEEIEERYDDAPLSSYKAKGRRSNLNNDAHSNQIEMLSRRTK